jgi:hypothetical protein
MKMQSTETLSENEYTALVYYRENIDRYDRVIGKETQTL